MTQTLSVDFPVPPAAVIPESLQTVMLWITAVAAVAILGWSLQIALRQQSAAAPLMVIGGFAAILMEPLVTFLGHAIHPEPGQIMLFKTAARAIPWHIALGYTAGFGSFYLVLYRAFAAGRLTAGLVWKTVVITAICYFVGEAYFVSNGLWIYYDYQPLHVWKGTAPVTWNWLNACSMLVSTTLMLLALPRLKSVAQLLLIPLAIAGACMGHFGAGFPMYNAMNSTLPAWAIELSGAASVALALMIVWLCSVTLLDLQERRQLARG
jgi:hypothetical protein